MSSILIALFYHDKLCLDEIKMSTNSTFSNCLFAVNLLPKITRTSNTAVNRSTEGSRDRIAFRKIGHDPRATGVDARTI